MEQTAQPVNQPNNLERILEVVERLKEDPQQIFVRQRKPVGGLGTMSLQPREVDFDLENLQKTVMGMIYEYLNYQSDKKYRTASLKSTTFPNTMLLDGVQRTLPDYNFLKCLVINKENVVVCFKDPLDLDSIMSLIKSTELNGKQAKENKKSGGKNSIDFSIGGVKLFEVEDYGVVIPYNSLKETTDLAKGVKLATELSTRIHQDLLLRDKIKQIHFADYVPIFKIMFPNMFKDEISDFLRTVRDLSLTQQIPKTESFHETKRSKVSREDARYSLDKKALPDHIGYIVACPAKQELYIRFNSRLDYGRIEEMLKKQGLQISEEKYERIEHEYIIKKGGGSRVKRWSNVNKNKNVVDEQGRKILSFEGQNIVKLYFTQNTEQFDLASKVVRDVFYNRLLYTTWLDHSDFKSDLLPTERRIIASIETLVTLYRFFLDVDEQKLALASNKKTVSPIQWITSKMQESSKTSFEERVLYTIQEMDRKIDPQTFYKFGNAPETKEQVSKFYAGLQQLKGRFEGVCAAIKTLT